MKNVSTPMPDLEEGQVSLLQEKAQQIDILDVISKAKILPLPLPPEEE